ncbi:HRDC domain-containing protein [Paenibacillus athensensis]|nr:HRDC domain-containing protein [Paenibacillus athensensis]MCD1260948.1 HRDC domain-containing protein [Paenibacillus athensensis]
MNIVFLNTLEQIAGEGNVRTGQVTIGETQGVWRVLWNGSDPQGRAHQELWYEGVSWEELLAAFRVGLQDKFRSGFKPLVNGDSYPVQALSGRARWNQQLIYFSELNADEELYEQLRRWRRQQAAREGKAPYMLATNRVLRLIAGFAPQTQEELLQIPGFGEQKSGMYGADVLKLTAGKPQPGAFPLDWVAQETDNERFEAWLLEQKEQRARLELDKEAGKRRLLELVAAGGNLTALQASLAVTRREVLQWVEELGREGSDLEPLLDTELKAVPAEEQARALQAFESEGDRYLKPVLQRLYGEEAPNDKDADRIYEWLRLLRLRFRRDKQLPARAG